MKLEGGARGCGGGGWGGGGSSCLIARTICLKHCRLEQFCNQSLHDDLTVYDHRCLVPLKVGQLQEDCFVCTAIFGAVQDVWMATLT